MFVYAYNGPYRFVHEWDTFDLTAVLFATAFAALKRARTSLTLVSYYTLWPDARAAVLFFAHITQHAEHVRVRVHKETHDLHDMHYVAHSRGVRSRTFSSDDISQLPALDALM